MNSTNLLFKCLLIWCLTVQQACGQKEKLTTYKADKFTIEYPDFWQTTSENDVLNLFPKENYGAVTISNYSGIDFPLEKTKEFIIDMNEIKDLPENVKMTMNGDVAEFYYEHIDKNIKWVTKAFRKKTDFFLLTINCEIAKWDKNKAPFVAVINSFKLN